MADFHVLAPHFQQSQLRSTVRQSRLAVLQAVLCAVVACTPDAPDPGPQFVAGVEVDLHDTTTFEGEGVGVRVTLTDPAEDGSVLVATIYDAPSHGTLVHDSAMAFSYAPDDGYVGRDYAEVRVLSLATPGESAILPITVDVIPAPRRIYRSPYEGIAWATTPRLKTQLHDHVGVSQAGLRSYDSAGYQVMSLMTYSGVASMPGSWKERRWPVDAWLPANFLATLRNIKVWIPNGEEVGYQHLTSAFMTDYIAKWEPDYYPSRQPWHYGSTQEAIDRVGRAGGLPMLAHQWDPQNWEDTLTGWLGFEIYTAFARERAREGVEPYATGQVNWNLQRHWDRALERNDRILGIAVNDHFGPQASTAYPDARDSGKLLVLSALDFESVHRAIMAGAFFAVADLGVVKDRYLPLDSLLIGDTTATVFSAGVVKWVSTGSIEVDSGNVLHFSNLPVRAHFVRAVVYSPDSSRVFTQAFGVRPVGDTDGDGVITAADAASCVAIQGGNETDPWRVRACQARESWLKGRGR